MNKFITDVIDHTTKGHFKQRVDEYLGHYDELANLTYTELAQAIKAGHTHCTLLSGETNVEVTVNGITFALGYKVINGVTYILTAISPMDVEQHHTRSFKCKLEEIA